MFSSLQCHASVFHEVFAVRWKSSGPHRGEHQVWPAGDGAGAEGDSSTSVHGVEIHPQLRSGAHGHQAKLVPSRCCKSYRRYVHLGYKEQRAANVQLHLCAEGFMLIRKLPV